MKQYRRVPFDIELAKKIQSGEVEGRIVTDGNFKIRILCFDRLNNVDRPIVSLVEMIDNNSTHFEAICFYSSKGESEYNCEKENLFIELPEETPKHEFKPFDKVLVRENNSQVWHCDFFAYTDSVHNIHYCVAHSGCQILPYKGNEYLVGTTDNPKEN